MSRQANRFGDDWLRPPYSRRAVLRGSAATFGLAAGVGTGSAQDDGSGDRITTKGVLLEQERAQDLEAGLSGDLSPTETATDGGGDAGGLGSSGGE